MVIVVAVGLMMVMVGDTTGVDAAWNGVAGDGSTVTSTVNAVVPATKTVGAGLFTTIWVVVGVPTIVTLL